MIRLKNSIEINAAPEQVFQWIVQHMTDTESYRAWHPDHVGLRWIRGGPLHEGSIVYAEEYIHGALQKLKFRITKVVVNREIVYRPLFPLSLLVPANTFLIEPNGEGRCTFTVKGSIRLPRWLFEGLHKKHKGKIEATERHMEEEGEALKDAVEESSLTSGGRGSR